MPGGRAVDDNHVIIATLFVLPNFAEHDHIVDSRRSSTDHVDNPRFVQSLGNPLETMVPEVLVEGISGRNMNDFESAARRVSAVAITLALSLNLTIAVAINVIAEEFVEGRLAVEFDHEDTSSVTAGRASDDSRYCCLPYTPLARHNHNICGGQRLQRTLMFRRHLCAD